MKTVEVSVDFIKEAHQSACANWKQRIEKELPDLFNKLEVGKWLKTKLESNNRWLVYVNNDCSFYGFNSAGKWFDCQKTIYNPIEDTNNYYATEEEVKTALINEAVKRGFVDGVKYKSLKVENYTCNENTELDCTEFLLNDNCLCSSYGVFFDNGKWATLITEPTEKELLGNKIKDLEKNLEEVKSLYNKL